MNDKKSESDPTSYPAEKAAGAKPQRLVGWGTRLANMA
jgi:hypothetical protein